MTKFTRFNRHESMNSKTLSDIMDIKRELYREDVSIEFNTMRLENMLSGLFDGYLYEEIQLLALELPTDIASSIMKIYSTCSKYTKI